MNKTDKLNKSYNQQKYVIELIENPQKFEEHKCYLSDLRLIALYLRDYKNIKPKAREEYLQNFCKNNCPSYNEVKWMKTIDKAISASKKSEQKLLRFDPPVVYDFEFDYINNLDIDDRRKRILFTCLVYFKFATNKYGYENSQYYIPKYVLTPNKIGKYSGIKLSKEENVAMLQRELRDKELLKFSYAHGGQVIASFIENIDYSQNAKKSLQVLYPEHSGLYYDWFVEEKSIGFCKECGDAFKQTKGKGNKRERCKECSKIHSTERLVVCIDCGKRFVVNANNTKTCRCSLCQKEHIKEYDRLRKQKFRSASN